MHSFLFFYELKVYADFSVVFSDVTGPAGTGKTETVKDLAKALGVLCVVTNCGQGMDWKFLDRILCGICQCGAWACFDEFDRLDVSVLSIISTQLQTIRSALRHKLKRFNVRS
jgi:dynein heavy chain